jgi:hypothetical protein
LIIFTDDSVIRGDQVLLILPLAAPAELPAAPRTEARAKAKHKPGPRGIVADVARAVQGLEAAGYKAPSDEDLKKVCEHLEWRRVTFGDSTLKRALRLLRRAAQSNLA